MTTEYGESYTRYQSDRSRLRRLVRIGYLRAAASAVRGRTLDFGCGIGELLERLPAGSCGVEYNPASVEYCRKRGLDVSWYDGYADAWSLSTLPADWRFESMVISHVLEHLDEPEMILRSLLAAAPGRGISRILVIVPGPAGFRTDPTHLTFVDLAMLERAVAHDPAWRIATHRHFPGNWSAIGRVFPHHELQVMLEHCNGAPPVGRGMPAA